GRVLATILEDREVDVPVAQPHAVGPGVFRLAAQLGQAEDLLVELGRLGGIVGGERDVLDAGHGSSFPRGAWCAAGARAVWAWGQFLAHATRPVKRGRRATWRSRGRPLSRRRR